MSELIISGSSGGFLRNIGKEYQEAAENFMRFMNDQGLMRRILCATSGWCFIPGRAGVTLASLPGFRSHQKWPASIFFSCMMPIWLRRPLISTMPCLTCCFRNVASRRCRTIKVCLWPCGASGAKRQRKKASEQARLYRCGGTT